MAGGNVFLIVVAVVVFVLLLVVSARGARGPSLRLATVSSPSTLRRCRGMPRRPPPRPQGNVYVLVHYQHPDDRNDAWISKGLVIISLTIAEVSVLMFPMDISNRKSCSHLIDLSEVRRCAWPALAAACRRRGARARARAMPASTSSARSAT